MLIFLYVLIYYTDMIPKESREKLSRTRQEVFQTHQQQKGLLGVLLNPKPMIRGSWYQLYKSCSYAGCRCHRGEKHGPFYGLSISIEGKRRLQMVRCRDWVTVKEKALAYRTFQKGKTKLRQMNQAIDQHLEVIQKEFLEDYP